MKEKIDTKTKAELDELFKKVADKLDELLDYLEQKKKEREKLNKLHKNG